jgi:very-short-patch-repair endonuclease
MVQPIKNKNIKPTIKKSSSVKRKRRHKEYGTSKLEEKFARDFLDKLKVNYVYQFKAESIGRYYDFYLPDNGLIIEVDGDYWHSKGLVYEEMTPTQKKNRRVDKQKDHWALINGIPILRIWESDINKHPEKVMETLKERLYLSKGEKEIKERKKYRNFKKDDN